MCICRNVTRNNRTYRDECSFSNMDAIADRNIRPQIRVITNIDSTRHLRTSSYTNTFSNMTVVSQVHLAVEFGLISDFSKSTKSRSYDSAFGLNINVAPNTHTSSLRKNSVRRACSIHLKSITPDNRTSTDRGTFTNNSSRVQNSVWMYNTPIPDYHIKLRNNRRWMNFG